MEKLWQDIKIRYQNLMEVFLYPHSNVQENYLTFVEVILLTFPFLLFSNFLWFIFSVASFQKFLNGNFIFQMISQNIPGFVFLPIMAVMIYVMFTLVTYPLWSYFSVQLWSWVIRFYQKFTGVYENDPTAGRDLAIASLSSNILLVFPIIGSQIAFIASLVQLLVGLHHRLKITYGSAILIIITPVIITLMVVFAAIFLIGMILSTFF